MPEYEVSWNIDIDSSDPVGAAEEAKTIQTDPDSIANVFVVTNNETGQRWKVDLDEVSSLTELQPKGSEQHHALVAGMAQAIIESIRRASKESLEDCTYQDLERQLASVRAVVRRWDRLTSGIEMARADESRSEEPRRMHVWLDSIH